VVETITGLFTSQDSGQVTRLATKPVTSRNSGLVVRLVTGPVRSNGVKTKQNRFCCDLSSMNLALILKQFCNADTGSCDGLIEVSTAMLLLTRHVFITGNTNTSTDLSKSSFTDYTPPTYKSLFLPAIIAFLRMVLGVYRMY